MPVAARLLALVCLVPIRGAEAQVTPLLRADYIQAIRRESSGELPLAHFRHIVANYSGFTPSPGGDRIAEYIAERLRQYGLAEVGVEGFPGDGKRYFWTFLTEPSWEGERGTLVQVAPTRELLADFAVTRVVLGRFSTNANVSAELVDVGAGTNSADYEGKDVRGKLVLASGEPGAAHAMAVWRHGAAGLVWYRAQDGRESLPLVANPTLLPWTGPKGEAPGFAFGIPNAKALELRSLLQHGQPVRLEATVKAVTGPGEYQQVSGTILGTEPGLREVWVNAHDNYRNTGGGNNLTGVGATLEVARTLATLIEHGVLPRPRRTIRFLWGTEHYASVYNLFRHPEKRARILSFLNVDMVGFHQERAKAVFHLYRGPDSRPHFGSDVAEEFVRAVGRANAVTVREAGISSPGGADTYDPTFAPTGSRDQLHYTIEDFWGPSDHEDVAEGSLGIPAVLYNDWPDPFIGTQEDDVNKTDPTQMRRAVLTIGATAYYLAVVTPAEVPILAATVAANAQIRLAAVGQRAMVLVAKAPTSTMADSYREAVNLLDQAEARERATVQTLAQLGPATAYGPALSQVSAIATANRSAVVDLARGRGYRASPEVPNPTEARLARLVPVRADSIRGPVHFFRAEYGNTWMQAKTGVDPRTIKLAKRGHYVLYETLNFADGKRSLQEIRDAVSAEYGPVNGTELEEYFLLLERAGVLTLTAPALRATRRTNR